MKTSLRRGVTGIAAAAVATLSFASPVDAASAPTVDIQQLFFGLLNEQNSQLMAQTFTADTTAPLVRVSLASFGPWSSPVALTIGIEGVTSSGNPSGTYLSAPTTWSGTLRCCNQFYDFDLTNAAVVSKGVQYALVVTQSGSATFNWYYTSAAADFTGGEMLVSCAACGGTWFSGAAVGADFAFKTWISTGTNTNQPPTVAADNSSVTVDEGTPAGNSGTFSDPDGDHVSLKASAGTLTSTGGSNGTWSWSAAGVDETPAQTVSVVADDGHGATATTSFVVNVVPVAPTATITTDPVSSPEGTAVQLTGGATSPGPTDNASFTYGWTVAKDDVQFGHGSGPSFAFTPNDEGTYVVRLSATDDGGMTGVTSLTVMGVNVPPTATIGGYTASAPLVIAPQESLTFSGAFTDPGKLDTHTVTWSFGDGTTSTSSYGPGGSASLSASHSYATTGTFDVTLTVADDDGGVGRASTSVTVQTVKQALDSVSAFVQGLQSLNPGQRQSLVAKLDAASAAEGRGDATAASNILGAFLNEVEADVRTGKLTTDDAATLRGAIHAIEGSLGTYNRFLEWWPLEL